MRLPTASPRPDHCATCACDNVGPLAERALRAKAAEYVTTLVDGSEIHLDIDFSTIAPFWNYLFEAIHDAGLRVSVRAVDGTTAYTIHKEES